MSAEPGGQLANSEVWSVLVLQPARDEKEANREDSATNRKSQSTQDIPANVPQNDYHCQDGTTHMSIL